MDPSPTPKPQHQDRDQWLIAAGPRPPTHDPIADGERLHHVESPHHPRGRPMPALGSKPFGVGEGAPRVGEGAPRVGEGAPRLPLHALERDNVVGRLTAALSAYGGRSRRPFTPNEFAFDIARRLDYPPPRPPTGAPSVQGVVAQMSITFRPKTAVTPRTAAPLGAADSGRSLPFTT